MRALRSIFASLYALVGVLVSISAVAFLGRLRHHLDRSAHFSLLTLLAEAFLPVVGCLFLIAAVSYWGKWRSARVWCILVGFMNLVAPFFVAYLLAHFGHQSVAATLKHNGLLLGTGLIGVLAFWRWDPATETTAGNQAITSARQGDGTISLLNRIYSIGQFFAFAAIYMAWQRWAFAAGLPKVPFWQSILQLTIAELVVVALHECGHALCGIALGQKVRAFVAGPLQWQHHAGRWRFSINPMGLLNTGGAAAVVPQSLGEPKWRELLMIAAGPFVGFVTGYFALRAAIQSPGSNLEKDWFPLAMVGSISLVTAFVNIVPLRTKGGYSDGARIYQLLRGGVWFELHEAYRAAAATTVTALRPRDYNIDALHRVLASGIATAPQQFLLHLLAHSYYLDQQQPAEAANELNAAESIYEACQAEIHPEMLTPFVINQALAHRDAVRARLWWDRMEAKKPTWLNGDYWMARSALCWVEGHPNDASAAWGKAQEYLSRMPQAGTYAFDREQLAILKRAVATESPVQELVAVS